MAKKKVQKTIAAGFALQLLRSPKKEKRIEPEDVIESSDEDSKKRSASQAFGRPKVTSTSTERIAWINRNPPRSVEDLCVHKRKVTDVRAWIESAFRQIADNTVLILTGSAGVGKTATVETLSHELDYDIIDWKNPMSSDREDDSLAQQFERFLSVSDKYSTLDFGEGRDDRRKVVLVEDIPNTFGGTNKVTFQSSVKRYLSSRNKYPLILIITETEPRGEDDWRDAMSVRNLLTRDILESRNCRQIAFNDIAPTLITKALTRIIDTLPRAEAVNISHAVLDEIAQSCNGDIRSAVNTLEFISHKFSTNGRVAVPRRKKKRGEILSLSTSEASILNIVTNREAALGYFHALGKICYNKHLPGTASTYDDLPDHLSHRARDRPENGAQALLDETSTDVRTFIHGVQQNYIESTTNLDQISEISDALSLADTMTRLPNIAGTYAIGATQIALPTVVTRSRTSKIWYPAQQYRAQRAIEDAIGDYPSNESRLVLLRDIIPYDDLIRKDSSLSFMRIKRADMQLEDTEPFNEVIPSQKIAKKMPDEGEEKDDIIEELD